MKPPRAERRPHVHVTHGYERHDHYYWLRERDDPAVSAHLEAENEYARAVMEPHKALEAELYSEMKGRIQETDLSVPVRRDDWLYYTRTEEGKQYPILCRRAAEPSSRRADAPPKPHDDEVDVFGLTHQGLVRTQNQDHFLICSVRKHIQVHNTSLPSAERLPLDGERLAFLAVVADGVGGGPAGETASRVALERVTEYVALTMRAYHAQDGADDQHFLEALQDAAWKCHASVVAEAATDPSRRSMATTISITDIAASSSTSAVVASPAIATRPNCSAARRVTA